MTPIASHIIIGLLWFFGRDIIGAFGILFAILVGGVFYANEHEKAGISVAILGWAFAVGWWIYSLIEFIIQIGVVVTLIQQGSH